MEPITVLSLFDGMSCGQLALQKAGIKVKQYYASEIDKYAITVTQKNFPDTIQLGDVKNVHAKDLPKIDLLCGGSPCQGFSFAGKGLNFQDERSKLFFEFVRLKNELQPKYFLLENVQMKQEYEFVISKYMGVSPIEINSALLTAQNRVRLYWTNINEKPYGLFGDLKPDIPQPKDKKILLKDILEKEVAEKYFISEKAMQRVLRTGWSNPKINPEKTGAILPKNNSGQLSVDSGTTLIIDKDGFEKPNQDKAACRKAGGNSGGNHSDMDLIVHNTAPRTGDPAKGGTGHLTRQDGKTYCLQTTDVNLIEFKKNYLQYDVSGKGYQSQQDRAFYETGKCGALGASNESGNKSKILLNNKIRRLTEIECERLQTVPDIENNIIFALCYESAKNYVSAVNRNPKLQKLVLDAGQSELNELVKNAWLSMSASRQLIKHTAPQNADTQTQPQTKQSIKHNQQGSNTTASNVENTVMCSVQKQGVVSVEENVFISITEGRITHFGEEVYPRKEHISTIVRNGKSPLKLFGKETMLLVDDVEKSLNIKKDNNFIYITSNLLSIKNLEQALIIYYLFAKNVITGFTQNTTQIKSLSLNFSLKDGYTNHVSSTQRYRMLGNGWTVDVVAYIFSFMIVNKLPK